MRTLTIILIFICGLAHGTVVLFYGENCSHCHDIIPLLQKQSDQIDIRLVNVGKRHGHASFEAVLNFLDTPAEEAGIPALLVGEKLLIGSNEIEEVLPLTDAPLPKIPGLDLSQAERLTPYTHLVEQTVTEKIANDPIGSTLALTLSAFMAVSATAVTWIWHKKGFPESSPRVTPILAFFGLLIAAYLAYLEITGVEGVCGPIGNCTGVQQSPWSQIFGIPVGILGAIGYLTIIALSILKPAHWALPIFLLIGTLFSLYLTLLEPLVIGAICFWCLTSASLMTLLLWLHIPVQKRSRVE